MLVLSQSNPFRNCLLYLGAFLARSLVTGVLGNYPVCFMVKSVQSLCSYNLEPWHYCPHYVNSEFRESVRSMCTSMLHWQPGCHHPSWSMPISFVSAFRNSFKFVCCSGSRQWTYSNYGITVLQCFYMRASGCWRYESFFFMVLIHVLMLFFKCGINYSELARDIQEAANFATYFTGSPAARSTPHLYISSLATWSQHTELCHNWKMLKYTRMNLFSLPAVIPPLLSLLS